MSTSLLIASRRWLLPSISKTKFQTILNYNVNTQVLICLQTSTTNFQFPFHASKMKTREGKFLTISYLLFNKKTKSTFSFKTTSFYTLKKGNMVIGFVYMMIEGFLSEEH